MKDIKLRIFDKKRGIMVYFNLDTINSESRMYFLEQIEGNDVMLFTGRGDDNGTDMFEGDIIKIEQHQYNGDVDITIDYIKYFPKTMEFRLSKRPEYSFFDYADEFEIIGNIYENPEFTEAV